MVTNTSSSVDRGWAWVILTAQFLCVFLSGTVYISGIFNLVFLDVYQESRYLTALCAAIHTSSMAFCGPITSVLISNIGTRLTIYLGAAMTVLGYLASAFATKFYMLFITYGFITGVGLGFAYMPGFVLLGFYFDKYRNLAYGIVTTAVGLSTMVFAPLTNYIIEEYGYRGCMLLMAGIMAHLFIVAGVMRPIKRDRPKPNDPQKNQNDCTIKEAMLSSLSNLQSINSSHNLECAVVVANSKQHKHIRYTSLCSSDGGDLLPANRTQSLKQPIEGGETNTALSVPRTSNTTVLNHSHLNNSHLHDTVSGANCGEEEVNSSKIYTSMTKPNQHTSGSVFARMSSDVIAQSLLSIYQMDVKRKSESASSPPEDSTSTKTQTLESRWKKLVFQYKPLFCTEMILLYVNLIVVNFGLACTYVNIPAYAVENGASQLEAAQLLSVIGLSSLASRLITGLSTNVNGLDSFIVYISSCGLTGIILCTGPLIGGRYIAHIAFAFVVGLYSNCFVTLMSPLTIDLVGRELLAPAYGMELLMCATGYLVGPPCTGALYDQTDSYKYSLIVGGVAYLLGAFVMMLVPVFQHRSERHDDAQQHHLPQK